MQPQLNDTSAICEQMNHFLLDEPFRYRYSSDISQTWINKSQLINAYHHSAFKGHDNKEYECNDQNYLVDMVMLPTIGSFGIIGNIGGVISFSKKLSLTYYALLFSLAISDLVTILAFIFYYSFPHWLNHYTLLETPVCTYVILWSYSILHIAQLIDMYLLIVLSIERYFAICKPMTYRARKIPVFYYIIPIISFSFIYSIPLFFEYKVKSVNVEKFHVENETHEYIGNLTVYVLKHEDFKIHNQIYKVIYETISKLIVKCIVPYVCLIATNILMVRTFYNLKCIPRREIEDDHQLESDDQQRQSGEENQQLHSIQDGVALRFHTGDRGLNLRQSQINLGFLNLAISVVFLLCYSIIWLWAVHDSLILFSTSKPNVSIF